MTITWEHASTLSVLLPGDTVALWPVLTPDPPAGQVLNSFGPRTVVQWDRGGPPSDPTTTELAWRPAALADLPSVCRYCQRTGKAYTAEAVTAQRTVEWWPRRDVCPDCGRIRDAAGRALLNWGMEIRQQLATARDTRIGGPVLLIPRYGGTFDGTLWYDGVPMVEADVDRPVISPPPPDGPEPAPVISRAGWPLLSPDMNWGEVADELEGFLRRVARPAGTGLPALSADAADLLVRLGATCDPAHIGPWHRVPGSDSLERCATCGQVSGK